MKPAEQTTKKLDSEQKCTMETFFKNPLPGVLGLDQCVRGFRRPTAAHSVLFSLVQNYLV